MRPPGEEVKKVVGDYIYAKEFKCKYCSSSLVDLRFSSASRIARRSLNAMVSTNNTFCQLRITGRGLCNIPEATAASNGFMENL